MKNFKIREFQKIKFQFKLMIILKKQNNFLQIFYLIKEKILLRLNTSMQLKKKLLSKVLLFLSMDLKINMSNYHLLVWKKYWS